MTFIIFISANIFRGHDLISSLNGIILCAYEIAFHASDLLNRSHDLLICANNLIFRTNDLIKRAHEIIIHAIDTIIYGGTFRTFIIFILENIFRGHDKISCSNGIILCAYEIPLHANDLSNRLHDSLICAHNLLFQTNDLTKRAHEIFIPANDIIIRWHDY